ncbi:MAG: high frequency lysogenization protein HflD [Xanthomonadales bacterium]|nr:high frequency lysogenization protein HflD [Xanthomonadales bacterium]NIX13474.1 high frequency lysogenization protein HflD [Xanthomonadales bacterium]
MRQRTLALAGVFQATELVRQAANHGTWSGFAATACLGSLLKLESDSIRDVYGGLDRMRLGTEVLISTLQGDKEYIDSLRYAIGVLQLERRFRRRNALQEDIGQALEIIAADYSELEAHEREDRQARDIAELYSNTISHLTPRIVVQGRPQYLQVDRTVDWIRTLLFSALRSAVLWNQMGGGRFSLMFGRQKMLREAEELLPG